MSRLLESWLESCWLPFSEDALLDSPDWSLLAFFILGLYSVITTVTLFTVTSLLWAVLRSMFFSLGGCRDLRLGLVRRLSLTRPTTPPPPLVVEEPLLPSFLPGFSSGTNCCWATCRPLRWDFIRRAVLFAFRGAMLVSVYVCFRLFVFFSFLHGWLGVLLPCIAEGIYLGTFYFHELSRSCMLRLLFFSNGLQVCMNNVRI